MAVWYRNESVTCWELGILRTPWPRLDSECKHLILIGQGIVPPWLLERGEKTIISRNKKN